MFKLEYLKEGKWIVFNSYGEVWCGDSDEWVHPDSSLMKLTPNCYAKEMDWGEVRVFLNDCFKFTFGTKYE